MGLNEVALLNRWNVIFSILKIIASIAVLYLGYSFLILVVVQMSFLVLIGIRNKYLFNVYLIDNNIDEYGSFRGDLIKEIQAPFIKSLSYTVSRVGVLQFSGILFTSTATSYQVAVYFLMLRIVSVIGEFSQAPFISKQPLMTMLRTQKRMSEFRNVVLGNILLSLFTFYIISIITVISIDWIISNLSNEGYIINPWLLLMFFAFFGLDRANTFLIAVSASVNHYILYWEHVISALISVFLLLIFKDSITIGSMILILFLPKILLFRLIPLREAAENLNLKMSYLFLRLALPLIFPLCYTIFAIL